jgi:hypothetical protein
MKHIEDAEIIKALAAENGFIGAAAKRLGCCRWTVTNRINNDATVKEAYRQIVEERVDVAENKLMELVNAGNVKAVLFLLRAKGKQRGYGDEPPSIFDGMDEPPVP